MRKLLSILLTSSIILSGIPVYADDTTENTESATETTTEQAIDTESMQNNMNQLEESFGKDVTTYDSSNLSVSGGNHGGTTMTLSEFQNMIKDNSESMTIDNDTMFNYMKNSLDAGEDINLSYAFSNSTGLEIPSNFMYDLSDCGMSGTLDASNINLQYADLTNSLSEDYNTAALDLSQNTVDATTLFENTYGDLSNELQIEKASLPSDFNFSSLSEQNQNAINEAYNSAFSSSDYNSIKNKVSTSSVFEEASKGLTMPDLLDFETLSNLTEDYNADIEKEWSETASSGKSDTWATYQGNLNNQQDYESSGVSEAQEGVKNKIAETESSNADARYKASTTKSNYIGKKIDDLGGYDWVDPVFEYFNGDAEENSKEYEKNWQEENGIYYDEESQRYYKTEPTTNNKTDNSGSTTNEKTEYNDNSKKVIEEAKKLYERKYIN